MRKKTIAILYILAILFSALAVIGVFNFYLLPHSPRELMYISQYHLVEIAFVLLVVAVVLGIIAWIGALVKQGKQGQWGWFACTLLFGGIALLIYLLTVPERSSQLPLPGYGQAYQPQPPMYTPSNSPS